MQNNPQRSQNDDETATRDEYRITGILQLLYFGVCIVFFLLEPCMRTPRLRFF